MQAQGHEPAGLGAAAARLASRAEHAQSCWLALEQQHQYELQQLLCPVLVHGMLGLGRELARAQEQLRPERRSTCLARLPSC